MIVKVSIVLISFVPLVLCQDLDVTVSETENATTAVEGEGPGVTASETLLEGFELTRLGSCPCDQQSNYCDMLCCCDPTCDQKQLSIFNCDRLPTPAQSLLSIHRNFTPVLGLFYRTQPSVRTIRDLQFLRTQTPSTIDDIFNGPRPRSGPYKHGYPIRANYPNPTDTALPTTDGEVPVEKGITSGFLTLPRPLVSDAFCAERAPVLFLQNSESTCLTSIDTSCRNPLLSVDFYLKAKPTRAQPNEPTSITIPISRTGRNDETADVQVAYRCYTPVRVADTQRMFPSRQDTHTWSDCSLQGANTAPDSPSFDLRTKQCLNTVQRVEYQLIVNGSRITDVQANVYLAHTPVNERNPEHRLEQRFLTRFLHSGEDSSTGFPRSGNPGYEPLSRVISAIRNPETNTLDMTTGKTLGYLVPDQTGFCSQVSYEDLRFLEDTVSQCTMAFTPSGPCEDRRNAMLTQIDEMIEITHVSRLGDATAELLSGFVGVIRKNLTEPQDGPGICSLPGQVSVEILYSSTRQATGDVIYEIVGVLYDVVYIKVTWEMNREVRYAFSQVFAFEKATYTPRKGIKSYYLRSTESCKRVGCKWTQLFYPLTHDHPGLSIDYALFGAMSTALVAIGTLCITRPLW